MTLAGAGPACRGAGRRRQGSGPSGSGAGAGQTWSSLPGLSSLLGLVGGPCRAEFRLRAQQTPLGQLPWPAREASGPAARPWTGTMVNTVRGYCCRAPAPAARLRPPAAATPLLPPPHMHAEDGPGLPLPRQASGATMKAMRFDRTGNSSVLQLVEDQPRPTRGPGQVLVAVAATSVNPIDLKARFQWLAGVVSGCCSCSACCSPDPHSGHHVHCGHCLSAAAHGATAPSCMQIRRGDLPRFLVKLPKARPAALLACCLHCAALPRQRLCRCVCRGPPS